MKVAELIEHLRGMPSNAEVVLHAQYEDPDEGFINAGGRVDGVRLSTRNADEYSFSSDVAIVEICEDLSVPSKFPRY